MRVNVVSEVRLFRSKRGEIVCRDETRAYSFWQRYLSGFDEVVVVARVAEKPVDSGIPVEGKGVVVHPIPDYLGPWQYLRSGSRVRAALKNGSRPGDKRWIFRLPGQLSVVAARFALESGERYAVELVGDPLDVFASGVTRHPLRPFLRTWFGATTRRIIRHADGVAYVTERTLQKKYPPRFGAFVTAFSSVELPDNAFRANPRTYSAPCRPLRLISVGRFAQRYKGAEVLIEAIRLCKARDIPVRADWIGGGQFFDETVTAAREAGVEDQIHFHGEIPSAEQLRTMLDHADIFVMPSLTEGLPRALLEAMARGLPCIASAVGGIPELLADDFLVPPRNPQLLAEALIRLGSDPRALTKAAEANLAKARGHRGEVLSQRRAAFYQWLSEQSDVHRGSQT